MQETRRGLVGLRLQVAAAGSRAYSSPRRTPRTRAFLRLQRRWSPPQPAFRRRRPSAPRRPLSSLTDRGIRSLPTRRWTLRRLHQRCRTAAVEVRRTPTTTTTSRAGSGVAAVVALRAPRRRRRHSGQSRAARTCSRWERLRLEEREQPPAALAASHQRCITCFCRRTTRSTAGLHSSRFFHTSRRMRLGSTKQLLGRLGGAAETPGEQERLSCRSGWWGLSAPGQPSLRSSSSSLRSCSRRTRWAEAVHCILNLHKCRGRSAARRRRRHARRQRPPP